MPSSASQPTVSGQETSPDAAPRRGLRLVVAGAVLALVAGGAVLWGLRGEAVFSDTVLAALAWCF